MDTSREYILQCEKAEEIQKLWTPHPCNFNGHIKGVHKDIWLPRQDQCQEMLDLIGCRISFYYTNHWIVDCSAIYKDFKFSAKTLEQAWLFIVMRIRWNKTWSWKENKWLKSILNKPNKSTRA